MWGPQPNTLPLASVMYAFVIFLLDSSNSDLTMSRLENPSSFLPMSTSHQVQGLPGLPIGKREILAKHCRFKSRDDPAVTCCLRGTYILHFCLLLVLWKGVWFRKKWEQESQESKLFSLRSKAYGPSARGAICNQTLFCFVSTPKCLWLSENERIKSEYIKLELNAGEQIK